MNNEKTNEKTGEIISHVGEMVDKMKVRVNAIDYNDGFGESEVTDLKLHLGYIKAYSDLAKVKLQYYRTIKDSNYGNE